MPGYDRTGPRGMGPMTGWGRGRCTPYGRGGGRRAFGPSSAWSGRGRGWRHWNWGGGPTRRQGWGRFPGPQEPYYETFYTRDEEMAILKEEAALFKEELSSIERRLNELETRQRDNG